MALLFGVMAALLFGASDFCAARASRHTASISVTRTVVATTVVFAPVLPFIISSEWIGRDLLIGSLAGVAMITGIILLYRGYSVAPMGIVAPTSSVLVGAVPVLVDLVGGTRPSALAAVGIVIGLIALVLTSYQPGGSGSVSTGAVLGLGSGVAFGAAFSLMGSTSSASGLLPVVAQRVAGMVLLTVVAMLRHEPFFATTRHGHRYGVVAGVFAVGAVVTLQLGFRDGSSGLVSVAASQFATVAVILSVLFNAERMRWWQGLGVAATAVGVGLMALG